MTLQTKVFILTEYPLEADCITSVLSSERQLAVCGSGRISPLPMSEIASARPDVVVMSMSLLSKEIDDFLRQKRRFVVVAIMPDEKPIWAVRAVKGGANGCIDNRDASAVLVEAIERTAAGDTFLTPEIQRLILAEFTHSSYEKGGVDSLSRRELEVYELFGRGLGSRVISERMEVSIKTVQAYAARIKTKLDLPNHAHLLRSATSWDMRMAGTQ